MRYQKFKRLLEINKQKRHKNEIKYAISLRKSSGFSIITFNI